MGRSVLITPNLTDPENLSLASLSNYPRSSGFPFSNPMKGKKYEPGRMHRIQNK